MATASIKRYWLWIFWAVMVGIQLLAGGARAADKLEVDLIPSALRVRSQSPIPVQVKFRWNGTSILEGHLEVELHEANRILGRYRSGDLALTTGEQTFHMLLPPCPDPFSDSQVEAQTKFVTKDQVIDLGYSILFMSTMNERSFTLGWCNSHFGADQPPSIQQSLLFERLAPTDADTTRKLLNTSVVHLAPEDLPAQALAYTSYDVMVLTAEAFKEAREGQLRALAHWVKGGGSVCVFVTGGLHPQHLSFLNELAESSPIEPAFAADADGNLLPGPQKISCRHSGLGRTVVVMGTSDSTLDKTAWQQAVGFLWKFRGEQLQAITDTGHWHSLTNESESEVSIEDYRRIQQRNRRGWRPGVSYAENPTYSIGSSPLTAELMQQLMPHTVRLIPFPALMTTLGLFLLMIGPVDYFVLGMLRRRRFTWILFPVTSIAFMIATVLMANYYLGLRDQRRSLVVVDLDKDGTALRWNRYELVFAARDKQAVTDLKDALWAPLNFNAMELNSIPGGVPYNQGFVFPNRNPGNFLGPPRRVNREGEFGPPWYQGSLPAHFQTSESLRQWQPQMNRTFSFEPPPVPLLANWQAIEEAWPNLEDIRAKLSAAKVSAEVCELPDSNPGQGAGGPQSILPRQILEELSLGSSSGLLSLISQVSPNGGGNFEDAQGLDARAGDKVLAIVTRKGDDIVVYRRFFHGK